MHVKAAWRGAVRPPTERQLNALGRKFFEL